MDPKARVVPKSADWETPGWDPEHWRALYQRWQHHMLHDLDIPHLCQHWQNRLKRASKC